jgi:hypothetical protein
VLGHTLLRAMVFFIPAQYLCYHTTNTYTDSDPIYPLKYLKYLYNVLPLPQ